MKRATLQQIADECHVTKGLVSRALGGKNNVSEEMREKIIRKATELGYDTSKLKVHKVTSNRVLLISSNRILFKEDFWQPIITSISSTLSRYNLIMEYFVFDEENIDDFLLKKFGYDVDEYYAVGYLMRQHLGEYIDAFEASSKNWHDNENDYEPFVTFILKRILEAYRKLDYIMEVNALETTSEEKVLKVVVDSATPISKNVVVNILYATSQATIEKALAKLLKEGRIQLITKGRYSKYFRT